MKPSFAFQWHITDECDQCCKHCYIFSEGACPEPESMPVEKMEQVLASCEEMCEELGREPYFYLTGGDPLLHSRFWTIARLLHERGRMWAVMGNPFHLNRDVCARLKGCGCRKYQLSLDGLEKTHDAFRMPGSFASTVDALGMLSEAGIWTAVMTTVSSANADEIPGLIDLVAEMGVDVYAFGRYCPTSGQRRHEFHMEPDRYREFLLACQERIEAHEAEGCRTTFQRKDHLWALLEYEQGKLALPRDRDPRTIYDGCHCGISHMTVTPTGDVFACRRMGSKVGNIFESSAKEIFLGAEMDSYRDFDRFEKCSRCELLGFCRGCPAVACGYSGGDPYAPDPQCWKAVAA